MTDRAPDDPELSKEARDRLVAAALRTPEGRKAFKRAFELGAATAADSFPAGSAGEGLGRQLAGLPLKRFSGREPLGGS